MDAQTEELKRLHREFPSPQMKFDGDSLRQFVARATGKIVPQAETQTVELEPPTPKMQEALETPPARPRVSEEMKGLLVQYCATQIDALELAEIPWEYLAKRLGTHAEHLKLAAEVANENGALWMEVMQERIKRVGADRAFRDVRWEALESQTLRMLVKLVESNFVKDPGQLLAIANAARRVNVNEPTAGGSTMGNQVNISFGNGESGVLPPAGTVMKIDMSPRMAQTLASKGEKTGVGGRVIDGQMLTATELRSVLDEHLESKKPKPEGDSE